MQVLDVFQITAYIKELLHEDPILSDVWVRGEVTSLSQSAAGHMYFSLASDGSTLSCVLFRGSQRGLLALPRTGESILAHGHVTVYEGRGQYQLLVDNVAPEGAGILQLQFEEMRGRLDAEGLFAEERKRPIPVLPGTIGVVTSPSGAVWHDIQTVIARRYPLVELILSPSVVQGPDAPDGLSAALDALNDDGRADVIILARGGGSPEDLACFNAESVARAIFRSRIPVVSAVGHETDVTIADLVADLRAATPSAAAELCVPSRDDLRQLIGVLTYDARERATSRLIDGRECVLVELGKMARRSPVTHVDRSRQDVDSLLGRGCDLIGNRISRLRDEAASLDQAARHLDPRAVLRRGYVLVSTANGKPRRVTSASMARQAERMTLTFDDGSVRVRTTQEDG